MRLTIALLFLLIAPPPTDTYTLSLHDALPISPLAQAQRQNAIREWSTCSTRTPPAMLGRPLRPSRTYGTRRRSHDRSEEHTSELQSHSDLVCRLLLEKKKNNNKDTERHKRKLI